MINQYDVYQKIKELNLLMTQVESQRSMPRSLGGHDYMVEINEEMEGFLKKRHLLNAAGRPCPSCGGTGKI